LGITNTTDSTSNTNGGSITSGGGASIAKTLRVGQNILATGRSITLNTTNAAVDNNDAAVYTDGGIKSQKKVVAIEGVVIPYGQALGSNEGFTNKKMLDVQFSAAGGLPGDATYLYTPGTGGNSSATYVLGVNAVEVRVPQTTVATSTTTGALRVDGGVGIAGNLHVGGTITGGSVSYGSTTSGTFTVTNGTGQTFIVDSTEASTTPTTGAARVKGGLGVEGDLNVGGTITGGSISYGTTSSGTFAVTNGSGTTLTVDSTTDSTSTTTGSVVLDGGIGIAKAAILGGSIVVGETSLNGDRLVSIKNANAGSSATTGVLLDTTTIDISGGTSELYMNGSGNNTDGAVNSLTLRNNVGLVRVLNNSAKGIIVDGATTIVDSDCYVTGTTASTSPTTGALRVDGGVGIQGAVNIGNGLLCGGIPVDGGRFFSVQNTDAGTSTFSAVELDTASGNSALIFLNGPNRTVDGGANTMTIRNDAGGARLLSNTGQGFSISSSLIEATKIHVIDTTTSTNATTGSITTAGGLGVAGAIHSGAQIHALGTAQSTSTTTGSLQSAGGLGVVKNLNVGQDATITGQLVSGPAFPATVTTNAVVCTGVTSSGEVAVQRSGAAQVRLYNNAGITEWTAGQRSAIDHDFKIASKIGPTETDCLTLNTSGQLKLGSGAFFGYEKDTWLPQIRFANGTMLGDSGSDAYQLRDCYWRKLDDMVLLSVYIRFQYFGYIGRGTFHISNCPFLPYARQHWSAWMPGVGTELTDLAKPYKADYEDNNRIYFYNYQNTIAPGRVVQTNEQIVIFTITFNSQQANPSFNFTTKT
jgi:hypothetical protein